MSNHRLHIQNQERSHRQTIEFAVDIDGLLEERPLEIQLIQLKNHKMNLSAKVVRFFDITFLERACSDVKFR